MEDRILKYISKLNSDKVRLTELIAHFTHDVSGNDKDTLIYKKILPALINMEKENRIKLSWDVLLTRYRFPRYIYCPQEEEEGEKPPASGQPLWQKQIEDILKKDSVLYRKKVRELRLQDKFDRFLKRYEKSADEVVTIRGLDQGDYSHHGDQPRAVRRDARLHRGLQGRRCMGEIQEGVRRIKFEILNT